MASTPIIGLIVFTNSLFLSCYYCIKSERKLADATADTKAADQLIDTQRKQNTADKSSKLPQCINGIQEKAESMSTAFYGLCCGVVRKETNSVYRFKNWAPVRYKLSLLYTSLLLISLAILYSESFITQLGADPKVSSPKLCSSNFREGHMSNLEEVFAKETNLEHARSQYEYTAIFLDALRNDTELYGTVEYACPMQPRTKSDFILDAMERGGGDVGISDADSFFPGHCAAALELEIKRARENTCTKEVCIDTTVEVDVVDVDLDGIRGAWSWLTEGQQGVVSMEKVEKVVRGCKTIAIPCPLHSRVEELDGSYREYQLKQASRSEPSSQPPIITTEIEGALSERLSILMNKGSDVIETFTRQIDIASSAYVLYLWISLFFPSPLNIFRSRYTVKVNRYIFGAEKCVFILLVLAIWWGVRYFRSFSIAIELQMYFQGLMKNPCYADMKFLSGAAQTLERVCRETAFMEHDWAAKSSEIANTLLEVKAFKDTCQCDYPCESLCLVQPESSDNATIDVLKSIGFGTAVEHDGICTSCTGADIMVQDENATFLANRTICMDESQAFETFFSMTPDSSIDRWSLWIQSGLLASMLVKTFLANFGVALYHLADPFSVCNGLFEGPPSSQDFRGTSELKTRCEQNIKMIGLRKCIIWGVLANMCLINIAVSTFYNSENYDNEPNDVGFILLGVALIPPAIAYVYYYRCTKASASLRANINASESGTDALELRDEVRIVEEIQMIEGVTLMEMMEAKSTDPESGLEVCLADDASIAQ